MHRTDRAGLCRRAGTSPSNRSKGKSPHCGGGPIAARGDHCSISKKPDTCAPRRRSARAQALCGNRQTNNRQAPHRLHAPAAGDNRQAAGVCRNRHHPFVGARNLRARFHPAGPIAGTCPAVSRSCVLAGLGAGVIARQAESLPTWKLRQTKDILSCFGSIRTGITLEADPALKSYLPSLRKQPRKRV